MEKLEKINVRYVDNRERSGIIWILFTEGEKEQVEDILKTTKLKYSFERKGSTATNSKAAWRVMFS